MPKYGVADYGLKVWYGNFYDYDERIDFVRSLGFDGLERLYTTTAEEALTKGARLAKLGMSFATVLAPDVERSIKWTAAMGGQYVWVDVMQFRRGLSVELLARQVNEMTRVCNNYGIDCVLHNHLHQPAETQAEIEELLAACPDTKLLFDVGHCAAGGGDVRYMVEKYYDRIAAYHFKGWRLNDDVDKTQEGWLKNGTFRGLIQGNYPVDNEYVYKYAMKNGFDGWFFIEHDCHVQDPAIDLAESLAVMKQWEKEVK